MPSRPMPVSKVVPESGAKPMLSQGLIDQVLIDQAARQGAAPDLMYVVDLPGYELAVLSVGVINDEGFGAFYNASGGRQVEMRVDRGPYACVGTCEWDGDGWYAEHEGQE